MTSNYYRTIVVGTSLALIMGSAGCATKKWVQTKVVQPMEAKIHNVDQKTDKVDSRVTDLDAKTERGISDAAAKAEAANQQAVEADQHAGQATSAAQTAQQTADKGVTKATAAQTAIDNIDNYQPVKTDTVLFGFNKSNLSDDEKQKLDTLSQSLSQLKHYEIDVKGFTDKTGPAQYNLELSRRRADAVVRYLTENAHVPLVKIHVLGYGEDEPAATNRTISGRKQNRRVEVKILAPQMASAESQTQPQPSGAPSGVTR